MYNLIAAFCLIFLGQGIIWFQSNGQFLWKWWKENPLLISFTLGGVASYVFIKSTYHIVEYFDGLLWPGKFIGFAVGTMIFAILTWIFMDEPMTSKTAVSLVLALLIISIQIFWK